MAGKKNKQEKYAEKMKKTSERIRKKRSLISLYFPRFIIALVILGLFGGIYFYTFHLQAFSGENVRDIYGHKLLTSFLSKDDYKKDSVEYIDAVYLDETNQWITSIEGNDAVLPVVLGEDGYWCVYDYTNDKVLAEYSENKFILQFRFRIDNRQETHPKEEIARADGSSIGYKSEVHSFVLADEQVDDVLQLLNDQSSGIIDRLFTKVFISSGYIKGSRFYIEKYRIGINGDEKSFELGNMSGWEHFDLDIYDKRDMNPEIYDEFLYWDGLNNHYGSMGRYAISSRGCLVNASCYAGDPSEGKNPISGKIDEKIKKQAKEYLNEVIKSSYEEDNSENASGASEEKTYRTPVSDTMWRACTLRDNGTVYGFVYVAYYKNQVLVMYLYKIIISVVILAILVAAIWAWLDYMKYRLQREMYEYRAMLTNTMAHDLKSPLMAISGYADNILENTNPNKNEYYIREIAKKTSYMNGLIENILELSKSEELVVNKKEQLDIANVLREVQTTFEEQLKEKGLRVSVEGNKVLSCDKTAMTTVLRNLFENAVKYSDDNGKITVLLSDEKIVFENPCEKLGADTDKLFDAYVKDDTSRTGTKGNGLGLAIVKSICDAHGYKVTAEYKDGLFTISIVA